jgi:hypothetical protein
MPLKKGTWVKLKGHETFGIIVEQRRGDAELPEPERSYKIHVEEQTLYYPPSQFEVVEEPTPERVSLREKHERFHDIAAKFLASPGPPYNQNLVKALAESLTELGFMKKRT